MPNWCLNKLTVTGPEADVRAFKARAGGHSPWLKPEGEPDVLMRNRAWPTRVWPNSRARFTKTTASACNPVAQININHGPNAFKACPARSFEKGVTQ